jgi:uncharacterized peroxidase-related enzyme
MDGTGFLAAPAGSPQAQALRDEDQEELGYVMNVTRLWAYQPETVTALFDVMRKSLAEANLTPRQRGVLVAATASARGDSYCSLAWGQKLSNFASPEVAAGVITGDDAPLTDDERAMAAWARHVVGDPNAVSEADVDAVRRAGFDDAQIFAMTTFIALRLAFSTVNDALGAAPDVELCGTVPEQVLAAVSFGRPAA